MHTRISDDLDEALQDAARRLRVPVSNLVRNVLEDVFDVVEAVTENVGEFVDDVVQEAQQIGRRWEGRWSGPDVRRAREDYGSRTPPPAPERPERPEPPAPSHEPTSLRSEFPDVAAWQPLVVNSPQDCAGCGRRVLRGDSAYLAVGGTRPGPTWLCETCLDGLD